MATLKEARLLTEAKKFAITRGVTIEYALRLMEDVANTFSITAKEYEELLIKT